MRLYHLGRLVGAPEWFGHPGPAVHPGLNRLIGEVELPDVAVTLNKSDVERGGPEWDAVEARMHRLLKPRGPPADARRGCGCQSRSPCARPSRSAASSRERCACSSRASCSRAIWGQARGAMYAVS